MENGKRIKSNVFVICLIPTIYKIFPKWSFWARYHKSEKLKIQKFARSLLYGFQQKKTVDSF